MTLVPISSPLTVYLQKVLANTVALTALTQNAHWNVVGNDFFQLHEAFGGQYDTLFDFQDDVAERIRKLDTFVGVDLAAFKNEAGMPTLTAPFGGQEAVINLLAGHEKAIADLISLRNLANKYNDLETQDLAIKMAEFHQKTRWMLKSYLK